MIDLIAKVLGIFFKGRFEVLKRKLIYDPLLNNYSVHLANIRDFILEQGLIEKAGFKEFYSKWLSHPALSAHAPILGIVQSSDVEQLKVELSLLNV